MKKILKVFSLLLIAIIALPFVACKPKNTEEETQYYSLEEVKLVLQNACEIVDGSSFGSSFTQNKVVAYDEVDTIKTLKINKNGTNIGKVAFTDDTLKSVEGTSYTTPSSKNCDIFAAGKNALKLIKNLIDEGEMLFLQKTIEYQVVNEPQVQPNTFNIKLSVFAYESRIQINVHIDDIESDLILISFDENKDITYITYAGIAQGEYDYGIYSVSEDKTYYLNTENSKYETMLTEIKNEVDKLGTTQDAIVCDETTFINVWKSLFV